MTYTINIRNMTNVIITNDLPPEMPEWDIVLRIEELINAYYEKVGRMPKLMTLGVKEHTSLIEYFEKSLEYSGDTIAGVDSIDYYKDIAVKVSEGVTGIMLHEM